MQPTVNEKLADALEEYLGTRPHEEFEFTDQRRWSIDLAFPKQKIAIEVDGRQHCRLPRHRKDCEKSNALCECGWRVMRYPAASVLTKKRLPQIVEQIARVLSGVCSPEDFRHVLEGE